MISGYTCVRNAIDLDYCVDLTIRSLLPVCSEVVVGVKESTDGTLGLIEGLRDMYGDKIRIIKQPWDSPINDKTWWTRWINETREHLRFPVQLMLDADEVLSDDPQCHDTIRYLAERGMGSWFTRLNFVKDAWHLIPEGHCIGHMVARLGPRDLWMPSDEPHPEGEPEIRIYSSMPPPKCMNIFHYGFLRSRESLYRKFNTTSMIWFGETDKRLDPYRETRSPNWFMCGGWGNLITPYSGQHPKIAGQWLRERGAL